MNLLDKYSPKSYSDFIGNPTLLPDLEELVSNNYPVILVGKPGIGKTTSVYLVADKLSLMVIKSNASDERTKSDLSKLSSSLSNKSFEPILYLLDEVDGLRNQDYLSTILKSTTKPVVMTANNKQRISPKLKRVCKVISLKTPTVSEVAILIKRISDSEGITVDYSTLNTDFRSSVNNAFNNGSSYIPVPNDFEKVERIFKKGELHEIQPIWLLDNVTYFYTGKELIDAIEVIRIYAMTKRLCVLKSLPIATGGRATFPHLLRRKSW